MPLKFELFGKEVHIVQKDFSLDFVANDGGLNAIPINEDPITVYKMDYDDPKDGLKWLNTLIARHGLNPLPCKITHTDPNIGVIKEGRYDPRKNQYTCSTAELYIISEFEDFTDRSETLNLRKLIETNDITKDDYQKVGYVLYFDAKALFGLLTSIITNLIIINKSAKELLQEYTRASVPPSPWIPIAMTIELLALTAITIKLIVEAIKLIPQKRSYYAIPVKTLLIKACKHLGYSFQSNLLDNTKFENLVVIGDTEHEGAKRNKTPKNNPVPDYTLGQLIDGVGSILKTRTVVKGSVVSLEETKSFYENPTNFVIPRMKDDETNPLTASHNVGEIPLSYSVEFATDSSDRNTTSANFGNKVTAHYLVDQYLDTRQSDFFAEPVINQIPFARAIRKNDLSTEEKVYNTVIKTLTFPLRLIPGVGLRDLIIQDEIKKCFKLEVHGINTPKILITDGNGFVSEENAEVLNAENLYKEYHRQYTLAGGQDGYAFWTNYEGSLENGLCQNEQPNFLLSKLNSTLVAKTKEGATAVLTMHVYNEATNSHDFRYRVQGWQNILGFQFSDIHTPHVTEKLTVERE